MNDVVLQELTEAIARHEPLFRAHKRLLLALMVLIILVPVLVLYVMLRFTPGQQLAGSVVAAVSPLLAAIPYAVSQIRRIYACEQAVNFLKLQYMASGKRGLLAALKSSPCAEVGAISIQLAKVLSVQERGKK